MRVKIKRRKIVKFLKFIMAQWNKNLRYVTAGRGGGLYQTWGWGWGGGDGDARGKTKVDLGGWWPSQEPEKRKGRGFIREKEERGGFLNWLEVKLAGVRTIPAFRGEKETEKYLKRPETRGPRATKGKKSCVLKVLIERQIKQGPKASKPGGEKVPADSVPCTKTDCLAYNWGNFWEG